MILPLIYIASLLLVGDGNSASTAPSIFAPPSLESVRAIVTIDDDDDEKGETHAGTVKRTRSERSDRHEGAEVRLQREVRARVQADWHERNAASREAMRHAQKELEKAGVTRQWMLDQVPIMPGFVQSFKFEFGGAEPRITLEIDNLPIADAIKKTFKETKFDVRLDENLPQDARVTLKVANVRLSTALDMLTESAGVNWVKDVVISADESGPKAVYRIQKSPGKSTIAFIHPDGAGAGNFIGKLGSGAKLLDTGTSVNGLKTFSMIMPEVRSKITCPHCKGKVIAYRPKPVERCEKCGTPYPHGKNVCPKDGMVRPTPPKPWKYCPLCGKEIKFED